MKSRIFDSSIGFIREQFTRIGIGMRGEEEEMDNTTMAATFPANLVPNNASTYWMNNGDNAWQLAAATFIGIQSVPGQVIIYGSIVKEKWAVNSAFMALYAFAAALPCWVGWGYRMSFGDGLVPSLGIPWNAFDDKYLLKQTFNGEKFPNATMIYFQFAFAAVTLVLIAGALLGRMNFHAWMLFVPFWLTFSYTPVCYSIWSPNGWLSKMGIIDFAGGFVVHLAAGVAGFTAALWVGPREKKDRERSPPNNILLLLAGAGLQWMGWSGFNGGAPYAAGTDSSLAILNTHVCTATSLLTWMLLDILFFGKPSVIGATQGMTTGLVCITPAAGVVQGWAAIIMGIFSGSIPWYMMMVLHEKIGLLKHEDDTTGILHTHAVTGSLGAILTGLFAHPKLCHFFYQGSDWEHYVGLAYAVHSGQYKAGMKQMGVQLLGIIFVVLVNIIMTSLTCLLVRFAVPLRLTEDELQMGDKAIYDEGARRVTGSCPTHPRRCLSIRGIDEFLSFVPKVEQELRRSQDEIDAKCDKKNAITEAAAGYRCGD